MLETIWYNVPGIADDTVGDPYPLSPHFNRIEYDAEKSGEGLITPDILTFDYRSKPSTSIFTDELYFLYLCILHTYISEHEWYIYLMLNDI